MRKDETLVASRRFNHVAVLLGGLSAERRVSLDSGAGCAQALESAGYKVTRVDAGRDLAQRLAELKPEVCFNALHGRWGEDGCVQGLLELMGIPYTHSGVLASALAMHKERAKAVMSAAGIPVADGKVVRRSEAAKAHVLPRPYVLKPVAEGSSVGVHIVREDHTHPPQELNDPGWAFGEWLLAERYIPGQRADLRRDGRARAGRHRDRPQRERCASTITRPSTWKAARATCFRPRFHRMFTNWCRS